MPIPNIVKGQIALDPINGIFHYIDDNGNMVSSSLNLLQSSSNLIETEDGLSIDGNLVVSGNIVTVNTEVLVIEDANLELGSVATPSNTTADGGGIILKGTTDKTFVWSNATKSWTSSENIDLAANKQITINGSPLFSNGSFQGNFVGNLTGNVTGNVDGNVNGNLTGTASNALTWTNTRTITLGGDLTGNVSINGSQDVTLNAFVAANSIVLGTDTTGDFVANLVAGSGITITDNTGEGMTPVIKVSDSYRIKYSKCDSQFSVRGNKLRIKFGKYCLFKCSYLRKQ